MSSRHQIKNFFKKSLAVVCLCIFLSNNICTYADVWGNLLPDNKMQVQSFFKPFTDIQIRDQGIIKYYMKCLAEAECLPGTICKDVKIHLNNRMPENKLDIILGYASKDVKEFKKWFNLNSDEYVVSCSINSKKYYAYQTLTQEEFVKITVFTEDQFKKREGQKHISHVNWGDDEEKSIRHQEKIDTPLSIIHSDYRNVKILKQQEIVEGLTGFFKEFGASQELIEQVEKFVEDGNIAIVSKNTEQEISFNGRRILIPASIDQMHVSDKYINVPVDDLKKVIYAPLFLEVIKAFSIKCGKSYFFTNTLKDIFEQWMKREEAETKVSLKDKYPEMAEALKQSSFVSSKEEREVSKSRDINVYENGRWIKHYKIGILRKDFSELEGNTIKLNLTARGVLEVGGRKWYTLAKYQGRFVEADVKDGSVVRVRIYHEDPEDGIEEDILFSCILDKESKKVLYSWHQDIDTGLCEKAVKGKSGFIFKTRLNCKTGYVRWIKKIFITGSPRLHNAIIEADIENEEVQLVRFIKEEEKQEYNSRVYWGVGCMRRRLFPAEISFQDMIFFGLNKAGLEKEKAQIISEGLLRLCDRSLDVLVEYDLISKQEKKVITDLNLNEQGLPDMDLKSLAQRFNANIKEYSELGFSEKQINKLLKYHLFPSEHIKHLQEKYRLGQNRGVISSSLHADNPEVYIKLAQDQKTKRGVLDKEKDYQPYSFEESRQLTEEEKMGLGTTMKGYQEILRKISLLAQKRFFYTGVWRVDQGGYRIAVRREDFSEFEENAIVQFEENEAECYKIQSKGHNKRGYFIIVKPDKRNKTILKKDIPYRLNTGYIFYYPSNDIYLYEKEILQEIIEKLEETNFRTTGFTIFDRMLGLSRGETTKPLRSMKEEEFNDKTIKRRVKTNRKNEWLGDEPEEMAVRLSVNDKNMTVIETPGGTGKQKVLEEIIYQLVGKRRKNVLIVAPEESSEEIGKILNMKGVHMLRLGNDERRVEQEKTMKIWLHNRTAREDFDRYYRQGAGVLIGGSSLDIATDNTTRHYLKGKEFDAVIYVDAQCEILTKAFLVLKHLKDDGKLILAGDFQGKKINVLSWHRKILSAMCTSEDQVKDFYENLLGRICKNKCSYRVRLSTSYRPSQLVNLVSTLFYENRLSPGKWEHFLPQDKRFLLKDIAIGSKKYYQEAKGKDFINHKSAQEIVEKVEYFLNVKNKPIQKITVLTATSLQKKFLEELFLKKFSFMPKIQSFYDYNGEQNDVILVDMVMSNSAGILGFRYNLYKKLNLACSGALEYFGIVMDSRIFAKTERVKDLRDKWARDILEKVFELYVRETLDVFQEDIPELWKKYLKIKENETAKRSQTEKHILFLNEALMEHLKTAKALFGEKWYTIKEYVQRDNPLAREGAIVKYIKILSELGYLEKRTRGKENEYKLTDSALECLGPKRKESPEKDMDLSQVLQNSLMILVEKPQLWNGFSLNEYRAIPDKTIPERAAQKKLKALYDIGFLGRKRIKNGGAFEYWLTEKAFEFLGVLGVKKIKSDRPKESAEDKKEQDEKFLDEGTPKLQWQIFPEINEAFGKLLIAVGRNSDFRYGFTVSEYIESSGTNIAKKTLRDYILQLRRKGYLYSPEVKSGATRKYWLTKLAKVYLETINIKAEIQEPVQMAVEKDKGETPDPRLNEMLKARRTRFSYGTAEHLAFVGAHEELQEGHTIAQLLEREDFKTPFNSIGKYVDNLVGKGYLEKKARGIFKLTSEGRVKAEKINQAKDLGEKASQGIAVSLINLALNSPGQKILFAIDENLSKEGTKRFVKDMIKCLVEETKGTKFEKILNDIIIIKRRGDLLVKDIKEYTRTEKHGIKIKPSNVIMMTHVSNKMNCQVLEKQAMITYVDDSKIDLMGYYPFVDIVLFTLAKALYNLDHTLYDEQELIELLRSISQGLPSEEKIIEQYIEKRVFTLILKPAEIFEYDELGHIYESIQRYLKSA
ncbi:MAG: AAA domain-containing protein [Candidatus Omnitrophota bacterium]